MPSAGIGVEKTNPLVRSTGQVPSEAWGLFLQLMLVGGGGTVNCEGGVVCNRLLLESPLAWNTLH